MKINKETKVAVFVIIAGTMLYTGFNFLKGIDFFSTSNRYYVEYSNVAGLQTSNAVILNGLNVGRVSDITILKDDKHTLKVTFDISKAIVLGDSARAIISSPDLLSGKSIVIKAGNPKKPLLPESYLIGEVEKPITDQIMEDAEPILDELQAAIVNIKKLVSTKNVSTISNMLTNLEQTTILLNGFVEANSDNLQSSTKSLKVLTASLVETEKQLKPLLVKVNSFADSLQKMPLASTVQNADKTISQLNIVLEKINKGEGTLGKLVNNDSLYTNLNSSARDLDKLFIDLRERPKRYVHFSLFGNKKSK